jgi:hypothetical protein
LSPSPARRGSGDGVYGEPSPGAGRVEWQAVRLRAFGIAVENATTSRDTALSG